MRTRVMLFLLAGIFGGTKYDKEPHSKRDCEDLGELRGRCNTYLDIKKDVDEGGFREADEAWQFLHMKDAPRPWEAALRKRIDDGLAKQKAASAASAAAAPNVAPPSPVAHDEKVEASLLAAIQKHGRALNWQEDFRRIILTSADWTIQRHPATGVITGRTRLGYAGAQYPDGHCAFQDYTFLEEHDGSRFTGAIKLFAIGMDRRKVDCKVLANK